MKKTVCIVLVLFGLAACVTDMELPGNDATGSDLMRQSPCVCLKLNYDARGFQWNG